MNTPGNAAQEEEDAGQPIEIPVAFLLRSVWSRRTFIVKAALAGLVLSGLVALLMKNRYQSTAALMPPDQQSFSGGSLLNNLAGSNSGLGAMFLSGGLSTKTAGGTVIAVLSSRTAQDAVIQKNHLKDVYKCKLDSEARNTLAKNTSFQEDKKSGVVSLAVTDRDPRRARDIAQSYVDELNELVVSLNTSSARREREFLEQRVNAVKVSLDESTVALSKFSSKNATLDISQQGQATVQEASRLEAELIAAKSELSGLKSIYTSDNARVKVVQGRIDELSAQLHEMSGKGTDTSGSASNSDQIFPSVKQLPLLGVTYTELARQVGIQQTVYELLTKQYELAKIDEARAVPVFRVLDQPEVPERKYSPHRLTMMLVGTILAGFLACVWLLCIAVFDIVKNSARGKAFLEDFGEPSPKA